MRRIKGGDQAVQEAAPRRRALHKQPVHFRHQPHSGENLAERRLAACRGAVHSRYTPPAVFAFACGFKAGPDLGRARRRIQCGGNRPPQPAGQYVACIATGDIRQAGAAQTPARQKKRDSLEQICLSGTVRPGKDCGPHIAIEPE
jgi:hypothetical protein